MSEEDKSCSVWFWVFLLKEHLAVNAAAAPCPGSFGTSQKVTVVPEWLKNYKQF